jgi:hypothetical protein
MKVNFKAIKVASITGGLEKPDIADLREELGKPMFLGRTKEESELGARIYNSQGPIELSDDEAEIVHAYIRNYSYVLRDAIEKCLTK